MRPKERDVLKAEVKDNWFFWRPISEKFLTYTEASKMYEHELIEVNLAIDRYIELSKVVKD